MSTNRDVPHTRPQWELSIGVCGGPPVSDPQAPVLGDKTLVGGNTGEVLLQSETYPYMSYKQYLHNDY